MTINAKVTGTATTIPKGLILAALVSLGITAALSALTAWLILSRTLPESGVGYCAMGILLLSSAAGAVTAINCIKRLRFQMGVASGAIYFICLLIITALFFGGIYDGVGVTALMILCGSGLVILLGNSGQNRAGCRRRKNRR